MNCPYLNSVQVANKKYLKSEQAIEIIKKNIGVIPVAITEEYRVIWLDVGDYPYREWKFRYATQNLIEKQGLGDCFTTDIQVLSREELSLDTLQDPTGFLFHMSKCGSTLISKVLDQSETITKEDIEDRESLVLCIVTRFKPQTGELRSLVDRIKSETNSTYI